MANVTPKAAALQAGLATLKTEADGVRHQIKVSSAAERKFYAKAYTLACIWDLGRSIDIRSMTGRFIGDAEV